MKSMNVRNKGIDIIKALSLVLVIIYHLYEYKGTYIGVVAFFVASGYLISEVLWEREISYINFIKRRCNKIFPPLITVLFFVCVFYYSFYHFLDLKLVYNSLSSLFGVSNIYQILSSMSYFERTGDVFPILHTWSLSIEIQFYLLYPFVIYYFKSKKLKENTIGMTLMGLSFISAGIMCYKMFKGYDLSTLYYASDTRFFSILVGGAFYFIFRDKKIDRKYLTIFAYISLILIIIFIFLVDYTMKINYYGLLYFISILSAILVLATYKSEFLNFGNKFFRLIEKLGEKSYVYYLWQYPIMVFSLEFFKWTDIEYVNVILFQIILLIMFSEISYEFLIKRKEVAKILSRIFILGYITIIFFLPISNKTTSEIIKNRVNKIDNKIKLDTEEGLNYIEKKIFEEIKTEERKEIVIEKKNIIEKTEKKVDKIIENKKIEKISTSKEGVAEKSIEKTEIKKYLFVGDSVMKMGEPYIEERISGVEIDAKVSRQFIELPKVLKELEKNGKLKDKDIVVVHLGTNGLISKKSFEESMKLLAGKEVYFVNTVVPKAWEKNINKNLNEWVKEYENAYIIDWHKYAKGKKELFIKDATHLKVEGSKKYVNFILENIKK